MEANFVWVKGFHVAFSLVTRVLEYRAYRVPSRHIKPTGAYIAVASNHDAVSIRLARRLILS